MKSVLYLVQAKAELPTIYACLRKRNFLLLSYKTQTPDTTIFAPNTTWTEGRNMLYEYVKEHKLMYDYYVFMDEDIILLPTSQLTRYPINLMIELILWLPYKIPFLPSFYINLFFSPIQESGYESLEASFELNYPIVTPLFGSGWIKKKNKKQWLIQTIKNFNVSFIAISKDAFFANTILPYTTIYDNITWNASAFICFLKANHYYRNGICQHS